jgi:hypothetical protein
MQSSGETSRESAKLCQPTTPTPSSPGSTGRSSIPETVMIHPRRRGVLDSQLSRGMTVRVAETELPTKAVIARSAAKQSSVFPRLDSGLLRRFCAKLLRNFVASSSQ